MRFVGVMLACFALVPALACGSGGDTTPGSFTVDFPTVAAGVATMSITTGVQVFAFATSASGALDGAAGEACQGLIEQSVTNSQQTGMAATFTTKPVATSALLSPCDLLAGKGSVPVPYGTYAFLAVAASSSGPDLLVGCAEQTISSTNTAVVIPLTLVNAKTAVPVTKCTTLSEACSGGC
jgi:hypothetical protein